MIFTQPIFFVFLALTFASYWLLKGKEARLIVLARRIGDFLWLVGLALSRPYRFCHSGLMVCRA